MAINRERATNRLVAQLQVLRDIAGELKSEHNIDVSEILSSQLDTIPLSIFSNTKLSSLELVVKYLKENKKNSYHEIAQALNRDDRTIWCTYNNANNKSRKKLVDKPGLSIPINVLSQRKFSILEAIILYLKGKGLSFHEMASILNKSYSTIYTTYRRGLIKDE